MQILFDIDLTEEKQLMLAKAFDCKKGDILEKLQSYGKSALLEYLHMFLGDMVLHTTSDAKEIRLRMMIEHVFDGEIPDEQEVARIFHLTISSARVLVRSVLAKYRLDLDVYMQQAHRNLLKNCNRRGKDSNYYEFATRSSATVDGLNLILSEIDGQLPKAVRKRGTSSAYILDFASYEELCKHFNLPLKQD